MPVIHDLIEISGLLFESTLSTANGRILDLVDTVEKIQNSGDPVEEFNNGDTLIIGGTAYMIDAIYHPDDTGSRITSDNGTTAIADRGDDFVDMLIIDVSNGTERRYFIIPSDSLGDLPNISSIDLGRFATAAGSDATLSAALNNAVAVCFTAGVLITTIDGEVPVEMLSVGDLVLTLDEGFQPLRWIGCQALTPTDLAGRPELRPVRIRAGA